MTRATTAMITDRVCWEPLRWRSTGMGDQYRPGCGPSGTRLGGRYGSGRPGHLPTGRTTMTAALSDLRVVEMGQLLAGPFCGRLRRTSARTSSARAAGPGDPCGSGVGEKGRRPVAVVAGGGPGQAVGHHQPAGEGRPGPGPTADRHRGRRHRELPAGTLEKWGWRPGPDGRQPAPDRGAGVGYARTGRMRPRPGYGAIGEAMGGLRAVIGEPDRPPARRHLDRRHPGGHLRLRRRWSPCTPGRTPVGAMVVDAALYEAVLGVMSR